MQAQVQVQVQVQMQMQVHPSAHRKKDENLDQHKYRVPCYSPWMGYEGKFHFEMIKLHAELPAKQNKLSPSSLGLPPSFLSVN